MNICKKGKAASSIESYLKNFSKLTLVLFVVCLLMTIFRLWLAVQTPLIPHMDSVFDDQLFIYYSREILKGDWLGPYSFLALRKNIAYSAFMCLCFITGLPYQFLLCIFLAISIVVFLNAVKPLVSSIEVRLILYCMMLFSAETFTYRFIQATYRMGIIIPLVLLIFSGYIAIYLRRNEPTKKLVVWGIIAGAGLAAFWFTMESSSWVLPFVLVCTIVLVVTFIISSIKSRTSVKNAVKRICTSLIPVLMVVLAWISIASVNFAYYGTFVTNDYTEGSFATFAAEMIQIDSGESSATVWVSRQALATAIEHSPTLRSIETPLWNAWDSWSNVSGKDGELYGDFCWWALRSGYQDAGGYNTGAETQEFWTQAASELASAFASGELKQKQGIYIARTMQPIRQADLSTWLMHISQQVPALFSPEVILGNVGINSSYQAGTNDNSGYDWLRFVQTLSPGRVSIGMEDSTTIGAKPFLELDSFVAKGTYYSWLVLTILSIVVFFPTVSMLRKRRMLLPFLLILSGLLLSCLVLIIGTSWFTEFFWASRDTLAVSESIAGYAIGIYPLFEMSVCLVIGTFASGIGMKYLRQPHKDATEEALVPHHLAISLQRDASR